MLATVDAVHLTGLPRAYTAQGSTPQRLTRRQLERLGDAELDPPMPGWPDCYVICRSPRTAHRGWFTARAASRSPMQDAVLDRAAE
jgi:hypothetical protein